MAKGSPARIIGSTAAHEGGVSRSGSRTMPWLSIIQHSAVHETHDASVVARAEPYTPHPRPAAKGREGGELRLAHPCYLNVNIDAAWGKKAGEIWQSSSKCYTAAAP